MVNIDSVKKWWTQIEPKRRALGSLAIWLFCSSLLPVVQILIMKFSTTSFSLDSGVYNIIQVTISSFLTSIFFVTDFWKKNRPLIRVFLVLSYLISFTLFIISLIQIMYGIEIFEINIFEYGTFIALLLVIIVGYYAKYDETIGTPKDIINKSKNSKVFVVGNKTINIA